MPRIDVRDIDDETLKQLDEQREKYGKLSRSEYIRLLIKLDVLTNIVQIIKDFKVLYIPPEKEKRKKNNTEETERQKKKKTPKE